MQELSIEERRHRLLSAKADSYLAQKYPALLRNGLELIEKNWKTLSNFFETDAAPDDGKPIRLALTPLIKPVGDDCNLQCRYCTTRSKSTVGKVMDLDVLEKIIYEILEGSGHKVNFIYHGGEPLMAGIDFFLAALAFQKKHARSGQIIRNGIQTNATLITPEWAQFLTVNDISVSISLDGPESAHDFFRMGPGGSKTHKRVLQGVSYLKSAGILPGAIAVVPPRPIVSATELLTFMQGTGIGKWRVSHCRSISSIDHYPDYIQELFTAWIGTPDACNISILSEIIEGLLGYPVHTCWMRGSCHIFIGFDPDGTVSPCCEKPVPPHYIYGNIQESSIEKLLNGSAAKSFNDDFCQGKSNYHDCRWQHLCGCGCAHDRIQLAGSLAEADPLCQMYQGVFSRISQQLDEILSMDG